MNTSWKKALQNRAFVYFLVAACLSLIILAFFMPYFFREVIAPKKGIALDDFLLDLLPPHEWSWTIFTLIYGTFVLTMITNYKFPIVMLKGLAAYCIVTWLRMFSIYAFTLEAPQGIIVLVDPFLSLVVYHQDYFVKDLFFSGHVSSMAVFVLMEPNRILRWMKSIATLIVACLILMQHVHYTIDIVTAPLFSYLVYWVVDKFLVPSSWSTTGEVDIGR